MQVECAQEPGSLLIGATGALRILENEKHPVITWGFAGLTNGEMKLNLIRELEKDQLRQDLPEMEPGDTVRVVVRVVEGGNVRTQPFEGHNHRHEGPGAVPHFHRPADRQSWNWRRAYIPAALSKDRGS